MFIDSKELIKWLNKLQVEMGYVQLADVKSCINRLETELPINNWIPCKERIA